MEMTIPENDRLIGSRRPRVLLIAETCNPEWSSLPSVGYKSVRALSSEADVIIATHVRNRPGLASKGDITAHIEYIDNEFIARPLEKLSSLLRGDIRVGWTTAVALRYPSYLAFEYAVWKRYEQDLKKGRFDIVHRITPMSPTLPSPIAVRSPVPFVVGPLNGGLKWPSTFLSELHREREWLTYVRRLHKLLPYWRTTYRKASAILSAFDHTKQDLQYVAQDRMINIPEVGVDAELFRPVAHKPQRGTYTILFVGRLVPLKLVDVVIECFATSTVLRQHRLLIVGDGPERPHLESMIRQYKLASVVQLLGNLNQTEVAKIMRESDIFAFPSIRELGAGVVVEAMASGLACIVVDYGGPGGLIDSSRGIKTPLDSRSVILNDFRQAIESLVSNPDRMNQAGQAAREYTLANYTWEAKAKQIVEVYRWVLGLRDSKPGGVIL
jgi:glycosyltransferase involved in cell wall biosynthesis